MNAECRIRNSSVQHAEFRRGLTIARHEDTSRLDGCGNGPDPAIPARPLLHALAGAVPGRRFGRHLRGRRAARFRRLSPDWLVLLPAAVLPVGLVDPAYLYVHRARPERTPLPVLLA